MNETEELLSLQSMKDTNTANELLGEVCETLDKFGLDLSILCGMATYGARAMSGTVSGLVGRMRATLREKGLSDDIVIFHCVIFTSRICARKLWISSTSLVRSPKR